MIRRHELHDEEWAIIEPLLQNNPRRSAANASIGATAARICREVWDGRCIVRLKKRGGRSGKKIHVWCALIIAEKRLL